MRHATHSFAAPLGRLLAGALIWITSSACAWAATATYDILLDTDNNPATGCTVPTARGDFSGVDRVLSTTVDMATTPSTVTGVTLESCQGGTLGAAKAISSDSWPVGSFAPGREPVAVIETFLPLVELGPTSTVLRAGVVVRSPDSADALLGADLIIRQAPKPGSVAPIPTISPLMLALLAAGVGLGGGWLARRQRASVMVLGSCVLLSVVGMAWAATIAMDGQTGDWSGTQPRLSGDGRHTNLVSLWSTHDAQNAYFRIDTCERGGEPRAGQMQHEGTGQPFWYLTRSGNWSIRVDKHTVTVTRMVLCQTATVQMWGDPHENLNGKHIKDWLHERRTLLLDDGTKITMHADGPHAVIHTMSIYDGPNSLEIGNDDNSLQHQSTDPEEARQLDEAEADGETAYAEFVPDNAPGAIGHLYFRNIYTQHAAGGPAPQCLVTPPVDPLSLCVDVPLGTTGDLHLNPNQVNDLYDDPRLGHT